MRVVICTVVLSGITFATVDGLETMRRCLLSVDSLLPRSQSLTSTADATALLSEIQHLKGQPFINKSCVSNILIPAENNCNSFLAKQNAKPAAPSLTKQMNATNPVVANQPSSSGRSNPCAVQAIPPVAPQVQANPASTAAVQPNAAKQQPAQSNSAVAPIQQSNNASKASNLGSHTLDSIKSLWQNVSPIIRYPIEASVSGISHLYSVNKPAAFAAGLGLAGTAVFLSWAGNKCLTNYDSLFCNPFRTPSFGERAAQFFGI